ncbi:FecR family protein [Chitinophaga lutea]
MEHPDKNIDWDKLLPKLEDLQPGADDAASGDDAGTLRLALEMRRRLRETADDGQFPADEGWQRFREAVGQKQAGRIRKLYWAGAAAAAVLLAVAGVYYFQAEKKSSPATPQLANLAPAGKVLIKSSNGQSVLLGDSAQRLQLQNGATVSANDREIVYAASGSKTVTMDTLEVPRGNRVRIELTDGTIVRMNAASRLIYPSAFTGDKREVQLEGEAYFEVTGSAARPFIVRAGGLDVTVLGTEFNVNTYSGPVLATLAKGKVKAGTAILRPGEQAAYDRNTAALVKKKVDLYAVTAWKDDQLYFEEASLATIAATLGREYDYTFRFQDEALQQRVFTLDMPRPATLQEALDQLSKTTGDIRFRIHDRTIDLFRK